MDQTGKFDMVWWLETNSTEPMPTSKIMYIYLDKRYSVPTNFQFPNNVTVTYYEYH